jgi:hypothetical protein
LYSENIFEKSGFTKVDPAPVKVISFFEALPPEFVFAWPDAAFPDADGFPAFPQPIAVTVNTAARAVTAENLPNFLNNLTHSFDFFDHFISTVLSYKEFVIDKSNDC